MPHVAHVYGTSTPIDQPKARHFPVKKTVSITLAVATALTAVAFGAMSLLNRPITPTTNQGTTPPTTIENLVSTTNINTATPKEQYATLDWSHRNVLRYQKGDVSWEVDIATGIEKAINTMGASVLEGVRASDFNIKDAFVDEKDGYVVAWGDIKNKPFGKISFRDVETGVEKYAYWLNRTHIDDLILLYDVPTGNGFSDYVIIIGDTVRTELLKKAANDTGIDPSKLPTIEILQLTDEGPVPLTYNPIVQEKGDSGFEVVNGKLVYARSTAVRDETGKVTLNFKIKTNMSVKGSASVALNDILKLDYGVPILGRFMP